MNTPKNYQDQALILRTQNLSEADRIIIMLTKNHGITHAIAKSIRKPTSKFGARLEPYMHTHITLNHGRGKLPTITAAHTLHPYTATIMANYHTYTTANTIAETCETLTTNTTHTTNHYTLTHGALAALTNTTHPPQRILASYLTRAMTLAGWPLTTNHCPQHPHNHCTTNHPHTPLTPQQTTYHNALTTGNWHTINNTNTTTANTTLNLLLQTTEYHLEKPLKTRTHLEPETPNP